MAMSTMTMPRNRSTEASLGCVVIRVLLVPYTQALSIGHGGILLLGVVGERSLHRSFESLFPVLQCRVTIRRQHLEQVFDERVHAPHHLHAAAAVEPDLVEAEAQEIFPVREGNDHPHL